MTQKVGAIEDLICYHHPSGDHPCGRSQRFFPFVSRHKPKSKKGKTTTGMARRKATSRVPGIGGPGRKQLSIFVLPLVPGKFRRTMNPTDLFESVNTDGKKTQ